jgi:hypothetical protein
MHASSYHECRIFAYLLPIIVAHKMCLRSAKHRHNAYLRQSGRCYYCELPMWEKSPEAFAGKYKITLVEARQFQCTAEHVKARVDGGRNSKGNIVAACLACNQNRHRSGEAPASAAYKEQIQRTTRSGKLSGMGAVATVRIVTGRLMLWFRRRSIA